MKTNVLQLKGQPRTQSKATFFKYLSLLVMVLMLGVNGAIGQNPNGTLDFGTTANGTTASTNNTGFGGVRVGSAGGGFTIQNTGQSIGSDAELRGIAPTSASINSVGITSSEYGTAATTFTISFEIHLSGGSSGTWSFFAGNGASFAATQSTGFTGAQVFTGIQWVFGSSSTITTNNRAVSTWTAISGTPFAQSTAYYVTIVGNNSASTVNYGASNAFSVAANTYDLWVNGSLVGNDLAKAQLSASTSINAFRFYGENSTSNSAQLALDNVRWYNTCVLPPTHITLASVPTTGSPASNLSSYTATVRSGSTSGPVANSFTGAVTVAKASGPGAISGTLAPNAVAGVATYANTQFDASGTYTISASAAAPIVSSAASANIVIAPSTTVAYSNTQFTVARNITRGTTELPIYRFQVDVTNADATLSSLTFSTPADGVNSSYVNTDITAFKAFLTTSTTFNNSTQLGATSNSGKVQSNLAETGIAFTGLNTTLNTTQPYYIWLTADVLNGATAGRTITVNAPTIGITGSVTGSNSATGTQTIVGVATDYYLNVGGSVTTSANYFTSPNGVGTTLSAAGLSITSNDVNLNIPITVTNTGDFTLGNGSKIVVQNGGSLTAGVANTITGIIDVNDGGTLTFNNTSIPTTLGTLGTTSSTVIYSASGAQAIATKDYANLTISGGNTKTFGGAAYVSGTLVINATVLALGSNILTPNTLTLGGLGTKNDTWGSTAGLAIYKNATYFGATGTGQVIPALNTAVTPSITGVTGSQSITYGAASITLTGTVSATGPVYPANGETVSVTIYGNTQNATIGANGSFSINFTTSTIPASVTPYTITYAYAGSGFLNAASNETSTALTVNVATNNWIGGTGTWNTPANWSLSRVPSSLNDNITISSGTPTMDVNYTVGTGRTLTISGSGALIISPIGSLTIAGTADFGGNLVTVQSDNTGTGSIGTISGTLSNASNVTVQRFVSGAGRRWRFLSSPVQSATVANWMSQFYVTGPGDGVTTSTPNTLGAPMSTGWHASQANIDFPSSGNDNRRVLTTSIRTYNESTSGNNSNLNAGWTNLTGTSQALTPGQGFRTFIRGPIGTPGQLSGGVAGQTQLTLSLSGTINQGDITPTLTNSTQGWNLLGNPYACNYNLKAQYDASQTSNMNNIDANYYVYDATTNGYKGYNPAASSGAGAGTLTSGIIPSGTSFFVQATGTPTFVFREAFKTTSAPIALHKKASNSEFSIKYFKDSVESDEFIISMMDGATLNKDRFDINKLRNENLNLSSFGLDTLQLMLSSIPPVVSETRIKLNVEATAIGTYNFDFKNMDNFESNITVSLFDRYTNKTTDVRKNTKYTFDMGAGVNQWGKNRFELILSLDKTNVDEFALLNQTQMLVYPNPATDVLNINISNNSFKNSEVVVYNISGTEVLKTNMANTNAQLNIETLSNGVYFVKVSNQNGFNKTVKFVK